MGAGKQTCGELAHFHKNAGKAPAGKNYAVKVNAGNHPRTIYNEWLGYEILRNLFLSYFALKRARFTQYLIML